MATWVQSALQHWGEGQAELARRLTERLSRSIDRAAVNKAAKGTRNLYADEMLAIAEITGFPIPGWLPAAGSNAEYARVDDVREVISELLDTVYTDRIVRDEVLTALLKAVKGQLSLPADVPHTSALRAVVHHIVRRHFPQSP